MSIIAGSWMQTPAGFRIDGGSAILTDFFFNASTLVVALVGMPLVIAYTVFVYTGLRGRVVAGEGASY